MATKKTLNIGLVGYGFMGRTHSNAFLQAPRFFELPFQPALTAVCAPIVRGSPSGAVTAWRRDAGRHPSPNAGVVEAAFAGALGVQLGGPTKYHHEMQIRPALGVGRPPTVADLRRAVRLSRAVQAAAALALVGLSAGVRSGR